MTSSTVGAYLFSRLRELGIEYIFGVPGDYTLPLLDQIKKVSGLRWAGNASELGAGYAADGYARALGLGVVCTTFGVGELSAANSLAGATAESVAVLHVVGAPETGILAAGLPVHHSFADGRGDRFKNAAGEIMRLSFEVSPVSPQADIDRALRAWATSKETTYLWIPQDLAELPVPEKPAAPLEINPHITTAFKSSWLQARALLSAYLQANPAAVGVVGHIPIRRRLAGLVQELADRGLPLAVLINAKGVVNENSSGYLGVYDGQIGSEKTCRTVESEHGVLLIGAQQTDLTTGAFTARLDPAKTLVMDKNHLGWVGNRVENIDFEQQLMILADLWRGPTYQASVYEPPIPALRDNSAELSQISFWSVLASELPEGLRIVADVGTSLYGVSDIRLPKDTVLETSFIWASIGFGLPAALGAALGDNRRVMALVGDGATQIVSQEFGLIAKYRLNPVIIMINNSGYAIERSIRGPKADYNDIAAWNWVGLLRAQGLDEEVLSASVCESLSSFRSALKAALADESRAHFIEVVLDSLQVPPTLARLNERLHSRDSR